MVEKQKYRDKYGKVVYLLELDKAMVEAAMVEKGIKEFSPALRVVIREWYEMTHKGLLAGGSHIQHEPAHLPVDVFPPSAEYQKVLEGGI